MIFTPSIACVGEVGAVRLRRFNAIACLLLSSTSAWSMDLLQAYEAAQKNDASILASRAAAVAGRERVPQALSQLLPSVSLGWSRNQNQLSSSTPNFLGVEQTTDTNYGSSNQTLSIRQPLFRSASLAQYRQAEAQVKDVEAVLKEDEQNLAVRVSAVYFDALLAEEQLAIVTAQINANKTYLDVARKKYAAGDATRTDADEAQARLDMFRAQEVEARQHVTYTLRQLNTLVVQPVGKLATLQVAKLQMKEPQPNSLDLWIEQAQANNQQLQALKARVEAARLEVDKAKAGHHPTLDAVAQWSRSESENVTNTNSRYTNAAVGIQLNVPLFAGGAVNSAVRQALASLEYAEQSLEAGRRDLASRVHREFRGMTESVAKVAALEQAVRSADQVVVSTRKSQQAGSRTLVDVLNAEQQRMSLMRELAQARYLYLVSKISLSALVNAADHAAIAAINQFLEPNI